VKPTVTSASGSNHVMKRFYVPRPIVVALGILLSPFAPRADPQIDRAAVRTDVNQEARFLAGEWGSYGFINRLGAVVVPLTYQFAMGFTEGLAPVFVEPSKCGYINATGQMVIEPRYKYCRPFSQGFASVEIDAGWTFINRSGTPISIFVFEEVGQFSDGRGPVKMTGSWGYIDASGTFAITAQYKHAWSFSKGQAIVYPQNDWRCAIIDRSGSMIFQPNGTDCRGSLETALAIRGRDWRRPRYAYVTADGSQLTPFKYEWAEAFSDGLAAVRLQGRIGYIDHRGHEVIPPQFEGDSSTFCARTFSEDRAAVMIDGKCGFIDMAGAVKIPPLYKAASSFRHGLAHVCLEKRCGYVDVNGGRIWMGGRRQE
jgi:hypothetical protein